MKRVRISKLDEYLSMLHRLYIKASIYGIPPSIQRMVSEEIREYIRMR